MDSMGKITDFVIAVCILFIIPVVWGISVEERLGIFQVEYRTEDFVTNVCEKGFISESALEAYYNVLPSENGGYETDLEYRYMDELFTDSEIVRTVYDKGYFEMLQGGDLTVTLKKRTGGKLKLFLNDSAGFYRISHRVTGLFPREAAT